MGGKEKIGVLAPVLGRDSHTYGTTSAHVPKPLGGGGGGPWPPAVAVGHQCSVEAFMSLS